MIATFLIKKKTFNKKTTFNYAELT